MIKHIRIQNFRSFVDAEVDLQPFSLVLGANGSGKTNLLRFFSTISGTRTILLSNNEWTKHGNLLNLDAGFELQNEITVKGIQSIVRQVPAIVIDDSISALDHKLPIYSINPNSISNIEPAIPKPTVAGDGSGTAQVLHSLKSGDREDLFDKIEENFRRYVPEVEKLSLRTVEQGKIQIQVREKGLDAPLPATDLSDGTRLILAILTILHQENPPAVILLEDIDRGLHPRLFEYVVPLMKDIAERNQVNILATSHNPYLVDCFQDNKEAVIIVEKRDGASTLTTLAKRLEGLDYEKENPEDMPLGNLWFTGLVGGTPAKLGGKKKH